MCTSKCDCDGGAAILILSNIHVVLQKNNDPFFRRLIFHARRPFYNFRSPKGDFEKNCAWSTDCVCANEASNNSYTVGPRWGGLNYWCCVHGLNNLEKVLNSVKVLEKYLISLFGLEKSFNFSTFLFLILSFKCYYSVLQINCKSYPVTFVIFRSVVTESSTKIKM